MMGKLVKDGTVSFPSVRNGLLFKSMKIAD